MSHKTVFLSSTFRDLAKHREVVIAAIESLDSYVCVCMEKFGARDWEAAEPRAILHRARAVETFRRNVSTWPAKTASRRMVFYPH
jgi:hypothetical protein